MFLCLKRQTYGKVSRAVPYYPSFIYKREVLCNWARLAAFRYKSLWKMFAFSNLKTNGNQSTKITINDCNLRCYMKYFSKLYYKILQSFI